MKNYIILSFFLAFAMAACEDGTTDVVVNPTTAPVVTFPTAGTAYILTEANKEINIASATWTAADFGYQAAILYEIQLDAAGSDFNNTFTWTTTDLSGTVTEGSLNNFLLAAGYPFSFDNPMQVRVCAKVSDRVASLCSDVVPITINPYQAEVVYPFLTVPGDYQGWNPADEAYKVFSRKSNEVYEGFIYFDIDGAVYKFAQGLSWDTNWGDVEPDGVLDAGGIDNNIAINDGAGLYFLTADLNNLMHTNQKTDWGVLGSAIGSETAMEWDSDRNLLTLTTDLGVGTIRFRANGSDDINFGDDFANGTLEFGGADIEVTEAGNYTIDLNLVASDYTFELTKN